MSKSYFAGVLSGFVGGLLGAYVLVNAERATLLPKAEPTAVQQVISASRIRLLDATGRARAELAMSPDGGPGLFFFDTRGRNRLVLGLYSPADSEYFSPSPDAAESVRRYLDSLAAGIGDPRLPLLTEGSRIFRAVVPRNGEQQQRIHEFFVSAGASRLMFARDLGLAVAGPGKSNLPIVLRRGTDDLWYVDEAKAWTYFHRFEDDTNFFVKYADNPFFDSLRPLKLPNMAAAIYGNHVQTPTPPAYPFSIAAAVRAGEEAIRVEPDVAANYAKLGDLYLFEMNWLAPSIELYEKASALAPDELAYRWRLMDLYLNGSRADSMLAELKYLAEHLPGDEQTRDWYRAYKKDYDFGVE